MGKGHLITENGCFDIVFCSLISTSINNSLCSDDFFFLIKHYLPTNNNIPIWRVAKDLLKRCHNRGLAVMSNRGQVWGQSEDSSGKKKKTARALGSEEGELSFQNQTEPHPGTWTRMGVGASFHPDPVSLAPLHCSITVSRVKRMKMMLCSETQTSSQPWGQWLRWLVGGHLQSLPNHSSIQMSKNWHIEGGSQSPPRIWALSTLYLEVFKQNHLQIFLSPICPILSYNIDVPEECHFSVASE